MATDDKADDSRESRSIVILRSLRTNEEENTDAQLSNATRADDSLISVNSSFQSNSIPNHPIPYLGHILSLETLPNEPADLPVANEARGDPQVIEMDEIIIDGVVIGPDKTPKSKNKVLIFIASAISISTLVVLVVLLQGSEINLIAENFKDKSMEPSLSPTVSMTPTSIYGEFLKELFIPISGEDVLMDKETTQNFVWSTISSNMVSLLERGIVVLNDTDDMIQRYVGVVVLLSIFEDIEPFKSDLTRATRINPHMCDLYPCNDERKMTVIESRNAYSIGRGGGILTKEVGELKSLTHVVVKRGRIRGTIPTEIGQLKQLQYLELSDNLLTGSIPSEIGQLENLKVLILRSNFFEGVIPDEIRKLRNLSFVDLSDNFFTGSIPTEIDDLANLQVFSIQNNTFSGDVDFLCDHNFSNGLYFEEMSLSVKTPPYEVSGNLGIHVDCERMENCRCCTCA